MKSRLDSLRLLTWSSSSFGFIPGWRSDMITQEFPHTPDVVGESCGHRRGTSRSSMRGFAQLMVNHTEIVGASNQIHARFKRMEAVSGVTRFARQTCQPLPKRPIQ